MGKEEDLYETVTVEVSFEAPKIMLVILKEFARRKSMDLDLLVKTWLDDRIASETALFKKTREAKLESD